MPCSTPKTAKRVLSAFIIDHQGGLVDKFTGDQSRAVLETKIRQMPGIIQEEKP